MEGAGDGGKPKKKHKLGTKGQKAKKKKERKQGGKVEKHNPRANTFSGGTKSVQKRVQFTLDKTANKERAPKVDKTPEVPPPFVVVVHGPPGVGKTTLIKSLVRHYCRQRLLEMRGPITLVSGRQRRLTIIECPQEMAAMLDLAKIADLVLLLIDASYGFELETFEFISILQVHGFPRVIGVLTHLDSFNDNKQLRKAKKTLKHRFWAEIYDGAKLFYFSGLQYGRYHRLEVQNLARFIAVQKNAILSWRQAHPYVLALRWEDQTAPDAEKTAPRQLDLYGYVYGGRLRENTEVHLAGVGDFSITSIKALPDPCPPPIDVELERLKSAGKDKDKHGNQRRKNALRTLAERHRLVYAPGSDVGSITVDSDTMYINVPEHQDGFTRRDDEEVEEGRELPEAVRMVRKLQDSGDAMIKAATNASKAGLQLLRGTVLRLPPQKSPSDAEVTDRRIRRPAPDRTMSTGADNDNDAKSGEGEDEEGEDSESEAENEDDDSNNGEMEDEAEEKNGEIDETIKAKAKKRFERPPRLEELIYSFGAVDSRTDGRKQGKKSSASLDPTDHSTIPLFDDEEDDREERMSSRGRDASRPQLLGNLGDITGLETSRMPVLPGERDEWNEERREDLKSRKFITGGWSSAEEEDPDDEETAAKKAAKSAAESERSPTDGKASRDANEAAIAAAQATIAAEGLGDGAAIATFVRIRLSDVPAVSVGQMRRDTPLLLGGLLAGESRLGLVQLRVKRHRWHPKILKSGDAMLLSVGWRRFQTVPIFSLEDRGEKRMRYLKYSLEHAHCTMTYYGPAMPPNTGVMVFRSWQKVGHFRIAGTGGVLETAPNFSIMKKLKLTGEPYKIFRNTAFIKNMFTSDLEVNKYMRTKIQTVSGIRGEIKKADGVKGNFRATFEDRILMSDIVICKCWIAVRPKEFYHPVVDVKEWRPARSIGELRADHGVTVPFDPDSAYGKQFVRPERKFNPLKIPKSLEAALPFKTKPKNAQKETKDPIRKKAAVILSDRERSINSLLSRVHSVRAEKRNIRKESNAKKKVVKEKRDKWIQDKRDAHNVDNRKKRYVKEGMQESKRRKAMHLD